MLGVGCRGGCRVLQGDSTREEAASEPTGPETEGPVPSPRGEEGKQSVAGVRVVLDDTVGPAQTSFVFDSLNVGR